MWLLPSEHRQLFSSKGTSIANGYSHDDDQEEVEEADAGDGASLLEISARDLARRALELVGEELGLS